MNRKVVTIVCVVAFYAILICICVLDAVNFQPVLAQFSYPANRSIVVFVLWYLRFLAYVLVGAGYGFVVHIIPRIKTQGKWRFKWETALLWGLIPILMPVWFTLYYQGIVDFMPVHMLRGVPNIPLYNIMGLILGNSLISSIRKQDLYSVNSPAPGIGTN